MKLSLYPPLAALALLTAGVDQVAGLGDALIVVGAVAFVAWVGYFALHAFRSAR